MDAAAGPRRTSLNDAQRLREEAEKCFQMAQLMRHDAVISIMLKDLAELMVGIASGIETGIPQPH